jgi:hypothetical protein
MNRPMGIAGADMVAQSSKKKQEELNRSFYIRYIIDTSILALLLRAVVTFQQQQKIYIYIYICKYIYFTIDLLPKSV